ncbi:ubiquitin carboxyl-terminal hydrolase 9X-like [Oscarella lobularis]|uniref:ubiquitin carboxyl-terminal hydrolase 9X-like n=1 Tax=Oscarella lobularis TaxID=121494 RepID=UPI00331400A2
MVLSSSSRFHVVNNTKMSENSDYAFSDVVYAKPAKPKPKGWLVDFVNAFGSYNGFEILRKRVLEGSNLNVKIMAALIRPFGGCAHVLTLECLQKYVIPCADRMLDVLESLTDDDLKREAKNEAKNKSFRLYFDMKVFESCLSGRSGSQGGDSESGGVENEDDIEAPSNIVLQWKNERSQRSQQNGLSVVRFFVVRTTIREGRNCRR